MFIRIRRLSLSSLHWFSFNRITILALICSLNKLQAVLEFQGRHGHVKKRYVQKAQKSWKFSNGIRENTKFLRAFCDKPASKPVIQESYSIFIIYNIFKKIDSYTHRKYVYIYMYIYIIYISLLFCLLINVHWPFSTLHSGIDQTLLLITSLDRIWPFLEMVQIRSF